MKVTGQCHCGHVRYEAEVDPATCAICHCTDCQALTGSAYRAIVVADADKFRLLAGEPRVYIKTTADSGNRRAHAFCPQCGAPIYAAAPENPKTFSLRVGGLDRRSELEPQRQQWMRSALPWSSDLTGVPRTD
jgi:hypothetical protein